MVGISSFLLVSFWYQRTWANTSAISAMLYNRVGDMFLQIGLFLMFFVFGNIDYNTIFALSSNIDENIVICIGILLMIGAMAKSAQIGLHVWLPQAMEGPTPVSALIHAATMVNCCHIYYYMLGSPKVLSTYIYNFISENLKNKCFSYRKTAKTFMDNQQKTKLNLNFDFSETTRNTTYNFENYFNLISCYNKNNLFHKSSINKEFLEWFIGFTEGDGSFIKSSKGTIMFDITQNLQDIQVLYYIKKELGFGKILERKEKNRNVGIFYVTGFTNFQKLIAIFNGNLSTNYKKEQFKSWILAYNNLYKQNIMFVDKLIKPNLDNSWITGFTDAEGYFGARVKSSKTSKLNKYPYLIFSLSQKDKFILELIKDLFKPKHNYNNTFKYIKYDKNWDGWVINFYSNNSFKSIIKYFRSHPLKTKKSISFKKWCLISDLINNKKHLNEEGLNKIEIYCKQMNKINYQIIS